MLKYFSNCDTIWNVLGGHIDVWHIKTFIPLLNHLINLLEFNVKLIHSLLCSFFNKLLRRVCSQVNLREST